NESKVDRKKFQQIGRRELLKLTPVLALGAFAIPSLQEGLLKKGLGFSDWASARLFRSGHLAPTFDNAELTPFAKFPINGYDVDDPGVIFENWTLTVSGEVKKPGDYTLAQVQALPRYRQNTRHICVEGWDVIGRFGGARLSDFLQMVGADPTARFITVNCADDYYESLDMATALHPQTLLCYEMYEQPLTREHGAPLRLQIPRAFPSFGAKIPQKDLLHWPKAFAIGGWLGGALQWHLTFMWIYLGTGLLYLGYQLFSGNYRQVLFVPRDIPGVWPMVKHYFFFGPKPPVREAYNPLQKQAYTSAIGLGVLSVLTGFAVWKPIQFSWLAWMMGGFHYARIWHFAVMWAILFFVLGHLVMVILHGWNNFLSMLTGWKKDPEYFAVDEAAPEGEVEKADPC